jgi:hypothetical protein
MNTRIFKLAAISAVLMGAAAAHAAAPTNDLAVKGTIGAPTCTVASTNNGLYDFGRIGTSQVKAGTTTNALPSISQPWTVSCNAATYLSFRVVDNRAASASSVADTNFGLGNVNGTGKLGYYTVTMSGGTVDGATSYTYATTSKTAFTTDNTEKPIRSGSYMHGWGGQPNDTQRAGSVFGADLKVTPILAGTTTMNGAVTEDTDLDGSLTLNFAFGL